MTNFQTENQKLNTTTGFSMIEMLVTMGIFLFVIGFTFGIGMGAYGRSDLNTERDLFVSLLYKARSRAVNNINESAHGLYIDEANGRYIVFQGMAYDPADSLNEEFPFDGSVEFDGSDEVVFAPLSGASSASNIEIENSSKAYLIEVNSEGGIDW